MVLVPVREHDRPHRPLVPGFEKSGRTRSTPRCSSRGKASPASTRIRSSPSSNTVMFFPTSPSPPSGMIRSASLTGRSVRALSGGARQRRHISATHVEPSTRSAVTAASPSIPSSTCRTSSGGREATPSTLNVTPSPTRRRRAAPLDRRKLQQGHPCRGRGPHVPVLPECRSSIQRARGTARSPRPAAWRRRPGCRRRRPPSRPPASRTSARCPEDRERSRSRRHPIPPADAPPR